MKKITFLISSLLITSAYGQKSPLSLAPEEEKPTTQPTSEPAQKDQPATLFKAPQDPNGPNQFEWETDPRTGMKRLKMAGSPESS